MEKLQDSFNFLHQPLGDYLDRLASHESAPGGGSAAALSASLGAALLEMVIGINLKKIEEPSAKEEYRALLTEVSQTRQKLEELITQDAQAFLRLARFFDHKGEREKEMAQAVKEAIEIPLTVCRLSLQALLWVETQRPKTRPMLRSDLKAAALFLEAAFKTAAFNVQANFGFMKDPLEKTALTVELKNLTKELTIVKKKILKNN